MDSQALGLCQLLPEREELPQTTLKGKARMITCSKEKHLHQASVLWVQSGQTKTAGSFSFFLLPFLQQAGHQPHSQPCSCLKLPGGLQNIKISGTAALSDGREGVLTGTTVAVS